MATLFCIEMNSSSLNPLERVLFLAIYFELSVYIAFLYSFSYFSLSIPSFPYNICPVWIHWNESCPGYLFARLFISPWLISSHIHPLPRARLRCPSASTLPRLSRSSANVTQPCVRWATLPPTASRPGSRTSVTNTARIPTRPAAAVLSFASIYVTRWVIGILYEAPGVFDATNWNGNNRPHHTISGQSMLELVGS